MLLGSWEVVQRCTPHEAPYLGAVLVGMVAKNKIITVIRKNNTLVQHHVYHSICLAGIGAYAWARGGPRVDPDGYCCPHTEITTAHIMSSENISLQRALDEKRCVPRGAQRRGWNTTGIIR